MTELVTAAPEAPAYRDRTPGLVIFGIVQILFGIGCAGFVLLMAVLTETASRRAAPETPPTAMFATNVVLYSLLAVYFFAVGIGSIRRRRWARALALIVSWMWLLTGIISLIVLVWLMPRITRDLPPGASQGVIMGVMLGTVGVLYVLIPAVLVLFYRSEHVKATCEAHDPKVRWTDRVPLPVLGVSLLLAFGAISTLASLAYATIPLFGTILTGVPAMIVTLAIAGLMALISVQLYRLKPQAWWTLLLFQIAGAVVGAITLSQTNFDELYTKMGIMTPQLAALHLVDLSRDPFLWVLIGVVWVGFLLFVIYLRRYFVGPGPRTRAGDVTTALT